MTLDAIFSIWSAADAKGQAFSVENLRSLVSQASAAHSDASLPGATYLFYTGDMPDGRGAWQAAADIVSGNPNVLTLTKGKVDVATLLGDDLFLRSLRRAVAATDPANLDAEVDRILNGSSANGVWVPDGQWDDASE